MSEKDSPPGDCGSSTLRTTDTTAFHRCTWRNAFSQRWRAIACIAASVAWPACGLAPALALCAVGSYALFVAIFWFLYRAGVQL
jgi:hypothetical protein